MFAALALAEEVGVDGKDGVRVVAEVFGHAVDRVPSRGQVDAAKWRRLARTVLIHGPLSRSALAVRLGVSPASLTRVTKPFVDRGILIGLADVVDGVGRPSHPLDVSPKVGTFLGVQAHRETGARLSDGRAGATPRRGRRGADRP